MSDLEEHMFLRLFNNVQAVVWLHLCLQLLRGTFKPIMQRDSCLSYFMDPYSNSGTCSALHVVFLTVCPEDLGIHHTTK